MGLITPIIEWATTGTKTPAYSDAKKEGGWVVGEPPAFESWNEVENARDVKINQILNLAETHGTAPSVLTSAALCAQRFVGYDTSDPNNAYNMFDSGDTIRDACILRHSTNWPYIVYLQTDDTVSILRRNSVQCCWNFDGTFDSIDVSLAFPATPDGVYALACDATYLFVAWVASSGNLMVSAFPVSNLAAAAAWTCDTGTTATPVFGTYGGWIKLIDASATRLVVTGLVSGAGQYQLQPRTITKATGVLESAGTGSYAVGYGDATPVRARPVSDGSSLFWLACQGTSPRHYYLISALLSDPTTSAYDSVDMGEYTAGEEHTFPKALGIANGRVVILSADGKIKRFDQLNEDLGLVAEIEAQPTPNYVGDQDVYLCSDGLNLWTILVHDTAPGIDPFDIAYKIPTGRISPYLINGMGTYSALYGDPIVLENTDIEEVDLTVPGGRMLFDGRDIWYITRGGKFFRITNPGMR